MADVVNTAAVNPLLPKPDFATIGSAQGTANLGALGQATAETGIEQAGLQESTLNLTNAKSSLVKKQQELQAKQAEAVRLQGEITAKESQLTSLQSALTAAQQDLENRRKAAEDQARQIAAEAERQRQAASQTVQPPPSSSGPVVSGLAGGVNYTYGPGIGSKPRISEMPEYQDKLKSVAIAKQYNMPASVVEQERELAAIVARYQSLGFEL